MHGRDLGMVKVDVNQFEQVIINLAVNARDAMPNGGTLTVRTVECERRGIGSRSICSLMPPGDYVLCEVQDTGTGIPKDILDKIWEPFFSTKDVGKGTGLGLSTVYGIIKQTGGFIFCDSEVGRGTVFRIYLPRHSQDGAELRRKSRRRSARTSAPISPARAPSCWSRTRMRCAPSLRARLPRAATRCSRRRRAMRRSRSSPRRVMRSILVISDVVMPEMDGPTLLKELRKRGITTKIIFISGYAEDAFEKNLEGEHDFAFLPKPFSLKQLAEAVKDVMGT